MKLFLSIFLLITATVNAQMLPATTGSFVNGVNYQYMEGDYTSLPVFPVDTKGDTIFNFDLYKTRQDRFATRYIGFIKVPSDKVYTFILGSDDGSKLFIDDKLIVNNDGVHAMIEKTGTAHLQAGYHKIEVQYFNLVGQRGLTLQYYSPTLSRRVVPSSMLFRVKPTVVKPPKPVFTTAEQEEISRIAKGLVDELGVRDLHIQFGQKTFFKKGKEGIGGVDTLQIRE